MFSLLSIFLFQLGRDLKDFDIGILKPIYENRNPVFDFTFKLITNTTALLAFGIPAVFLIISLIKKDPVVHRRALVILISVAISAILANILKYIVDLPRPYQVYPFIHKLSVGGSPSFPSGHTADAFAFAIAAALAFRKWYITLISLAWAAMVGYSRMYLGVHFPTDVIAGALIGAICSLACYIFIQLKNPLPPGTSN
jgi:membrane-associated phospholipid phosphatase